jgi:pimeloyl-ACP methyl ester carboxylesterase
VPDFVSPPQTNAVTVPVPGLRAPERIISWTGLSIAHPSAFAEALETAPDQQARSRYFFLFTSPWLPETLLSFNDLKLLKLGHTGLPDAQVKEYIGMLGEPGALTAVLNWYRAMDLGENALSAVGTDISAPSLFIWGNQDVSAGRRAVELQRDSMLGPYEEIELDAGLWLIREKPEQVIETVLDHLLAFNNQET